MIRKTVREKVEIKKRGKARNSNWWAKREAEAEARVEVRSCSQGRPRRKKVEKLQMSAQMQNILKMIAEVNPAVIRMRMV